LSPCTPKFGPFLWRREASWVRVDFAIPPPVATEELAPQRHTI
jgi:hypothetical protein